MSGAAEPAPDGRSPWRSLLLGILGGALLLALLMLLLRALGWSWWGAE